MPYLTPEKKREMDHGLPPENAGELTYVITRQLQRYLGPKSSVRYEHLAIVLGALEGAKADFLQRVVLPYEERKRQENGDCW